MKRPNLIAIALLAAFALPLSTRPGAQDVEQKAQGARPSAELVESFDGLGFGFSGPQGKSSGRNPSDNSLAVGPDHIVQTVNSQIAVFTKKGTQYDTTGKVLYGPIATNTMFAGFGGVCEARPNGDAVVRYDQLAHRWLVVMPIFRRAVVRDPAEKADLTRPAPPGEAARPGQAADPGKAAPPGPPPPLPPQGQRGQGGPPAQPGQPAQTPPAPAPPAQPQATYAMCYAISATPDPLGAYFRYAFERPLFPDYPRPAVWSDGYYTPTSTGDHVIQKHACVVDRESMLAGRPATEQCHVIDGVNFLNTADLDGTELPPPGSPNIMMAAGGIQLKQDFDDDGIYVWTFHVDWKTPSKTAVTGPVKINVAPYQYLCNGQLTNCVPQPDTDRRLDAQGDKIMARLVYRRMGDRESLVAVHSVNAAEGGGGVRWYEFRLNDKRDVELHQQGTYAPDVFFRWMASPAIDRFGNIGIGYSFGGRQHYPGQRFAGRLADDPKGQLTLRETVLVEGESSQTNTLRWEDYTQTAMDPVDDCTIWYVGDYIKKDATSYSTRIGGFRMPGCRGAAPPAPRREMAVTIDDLPTVSVLGNDIVAAERTTAGLLAAIRKHRVPAIGFVNEAKLRTGGTVDERRVALLEQWIGAGLELGNHTFSHRDLHQTPLPTYQREVIEGEKITRRLLKAAGRDLTFFRHPMLHTGRSVQVQQAFASFLDKHGYRVAPVTVDNHDYIFAAAFDRASGRGGRAAQQRISAAYLDYMEAVTAYYEQQSTALLGRELRQVLLLHANALNAALFDDLAARFEARGYKFVTLDQALADPAYALKEEYVGPAGITWLHRWAMAQGKRGAFFAGEPPVPDWIQQAATR